MVCIKEEILIDRNTYLIGVVLISVSVTTHLIYDAFPNHDVYIYSLIAGLLSIPYYYSAKLVGIWLFGEFGKTGLLRSLKTKLKNTAFYKWLTLSSKNGSGKDV